MRALKQATGDPLKVPIPWHRVINSRGQLSTDKNPDIPQGLQRVLLEREGITFDHEERLDLDRHLWRDGLSMTVEGDAVRRR